MKLLKKLVNKVKKVKSYVLLLLSYFRDTARTKIVRRASEEDELYIYLEDKDLYPSPVFGRYLYLFVSFLTIGRKQVVILKENNFQDYIRMGEYGRRIYTIKNLFFATNVSEQTKDKILIQDKPSETLRKRTWKKLVNINFDITSSTLNENSRVIMPYTMHPDHYNVYEHERLQKLRGSARKIRLFFAGNTSQKYLNSVWLSEKFDILLRPHVIQAIELHSKDLLKVETYDELLNLINGNYMHKCLVTDARIPSEQWLEMIATCDFFICCPGVNMPLCHNAVESMAVGTIPLINYADCFLPPFEHLKTCVKFSSKQDLLEKVDLIMQMDQQQIDELRRNVIEYYEENLSPTNFFNKIVDDPEPEITLLLPYLKIGSDNEQCEKFLNWIYKEKNAKF